MAAKFRHLLRLFKLYARMDAQWFLKDTALCVICIISETISTLAGITGIFLLSLQFGGFNTGEISRRIGRGQLDHSLIQPIPIWMQLITESFIPVSGCQSVLCGLGVIIAAMIRMQLSVTPLWILIFILFLFASLAVQVGMRYIVAYSAFTHPVGAEEISSMMGSFLTSIGYYPLSALPMWAQGILVTVLPAGCLAWLPSMILMEKAPFSGAAALFPLIAVLIGGTGILAFQKGMKIYAKYGSQRYKNMGHRS